MEKKRKNYNKKLDVTILVNRIASGISVTSAGVSVATGVTFVGIPVAIGSGLFGVLSACVSLVLSALNKKYKKRLDGNNQMQDILSQGMVLFEKVLGKALTNDDVIDQEELNELTAIYVNLIANDFHGKGCVTMRDWLKIYNLIDVVPFVEALEKIRNNYVKDDIDMLKDAVSIPGISMAYVINKAIKLKERNDPYLYFTWTTLHP